ncbi:signal transduction histidine kinase [Limnobacter thiooxidans]|uniref:Virulence sensor protein BvgS n=1 Tax=Limnobacter thiooxidans TaxID=131080 RepID=A0AA86J082_9BURK|nr:signal transduction histidine kinase [Limnobacter thiooxidans]BET27019.1 hypothetical protein RGQ30_25200 [Limnobacter thiooxidans]
MKILYVEDDEHIQWLTGTLLTTLDHEITEAANAAQAWSLLEQNPKQFDCLILDKNLPECSGLDLLKAIRSSAWHYDIPVIMLTAEAGNNGLIECLEGGVSLYLSKPATRELLKAALEQLQGENRKRLGLLNLSNQFSSAVSNLTEGYFRIQNPSQAKSLAFLLSQQTQNPDRTYLGILEVLVNSIEHGNIRFNNSQLKNQLGKSDLHAQLDSLSKQPPFCEKWVDVRLSSDDFITRIEVRDQGIGFDWKRTLSQNQGNRSLGDIHGMHRILNAGFLDFHYLDGGCTAVIVIKKTPSKNGIKPENNTDSVALSDPFEPASTSKPQETAERLEKKSPRTVEYKVTNGDLFNCSNGELLKAINQITSGFIASNDFGKFFELTLDVILSVTGSEYGFLSELMHDENESPYMRAYAISNIAWDEHSQERYECFTREGHMDFHAMDNLFGSVLLSGEPLIANHTKTHYSAGGFPKGHRNMEAFLGIPLMGSGKVLGMVAIANRPGGYHPEMIEWLEPVRSTLSSIIISMRNERHRLMIEKQLKEAKEIAERANDAKSFFLATISHEIRTPMNAIVGMSELLMNSPLTTSQTYFAKVINRNTELLLSIINDVLNLSKIKAGKMKVIEGDFDLEEVLSEVAEILGHSATEKNLGLIMSYPLQLPRKLHGDAAKIKQILINLVNNAIKFTDKGHVLVSVSTPERSRICIDIQDTGIGISEESIPQLFSPFHQVDQTASREHGGTGLGLAISQKFAQLLEGHIRIQSQKGIGSTFSFEFPIKTTEEINSSRHTNIKDLEVCFITSSKEVQRLAQCHMRQYQGVKVHVCETAHTAAIEQNHSCANERRLILIEQNHPGLRYQSNRQERIQTGFDVFAAHGNADCSETNDGFHQSNILGVVSKHFGFESFDQTLSQIVGKLNGQETDNPGELNTIDQGKVLNELGLDGLSGTSAPPNILLVEDNPINQDVASLVLTQMGCLVDVAFNGIQALEKYARHTYDLILMDCQMPVMDGLTATAKIRELEQARNAERTPIVAITANALPTDRASCINAGMDDYLAKPFKRSQVKDILKKFLIPASGEQGKAVSAIEILQNCEDPVFDANLMREITHDNWELLNKIILKYRSSLPGQIEQLSKLIADGETSALCAELHRMRGSAVGTGFGLFAAYLKAIETDVRSGRSRDTAKTVEQLNEHFKAIMAFSISENRHPA